MPEECKRQFKVCKTFGRFPARRYVFVFIARRTMTDVEMFEL